MPRMFANRAVLRQTRAYMWSDLGGRQCRDHLQTFSKVDRRNAMLRRHRAMVRNALEPCTARGSAASRRHANRLKLIVAPVFWRSALGSVVTENKPSLKSTLVDEEGGVGVGLDVIPVDLVVLDQVIDDAAQKGDVGARAQRGIQIGQGGRFREHRIDDDQLGAAMLDGFGDVLETNRVCNGGIAAHDQNDVGVLDVIPVIRHRTTPKRRSQTGYRRGVSKTRAGCRSRPSPVSVPSSRRDNWLRCKTKATKSSRWCSSGDDDALFVLSKKLASRSDFRCLAMRSIASSQPICFHSVLPGARTSGNTARWASGPNPEPPIPWRTRCRD